MFAGQADIFNGDELVVASKFPGRCIIDKESCSRPKVKKPPFENWR